jgi:hypothetical protein
MRVFGDAVNGGRGGRFQAIGALDAGHTLGHWMAKVGTLSPALPLSFRNLLVM